MGKSRKSSSVPTDDEVSPEVLAVRKALQNIGVIPLDVTVFDFGVVTLMWPPLFSETPSPRATLYFTVELARDDYTSVLSHAIAANDRVLPRHSSASIQDVRLTVDLTNEQPDLCDELLVTVAKSFLDRVEMGAQRIVELHHKMEDKVVPATSLNAKREGTRHYARHQLARR